MVLTVRDVIPQSRLATYGNFEYQIDEIERIFAYEDMFHDFSVNRNYDVLEFWMLDVIEKMCLSLVSCDGNATLSLQHLQQLKLHTSDSVHSTQQQSCAKCREEDCWDSRFLFNFAKPTYNDIPKAYRREVIGGRFSSDCIFPDEFMLPHVIDAEGLQAIAYIGTSAWRNANKGSITSLNDQVREKEHHSDCESPIPVYMRPNESYSSPLKQVWSKGVNFKNLIMLSPPCHSWRISRRHRERDLQGNNKSQRTSCSKSSSRRLYSDVLSPLDVTSESPDACGVDVQPLFPTE